MHIWLVRPVWLVYICIFRMPWNKICCPTMSFKKGNIREAYQVNLIPSVCKLLVCSCLFCASKAYHLYHTMAWIERRSDCPQMSLFLDYIGYVINFSEDHTNHEEFGWHFVSLPDDNGFDGWKDYQPICRERESFSQLWTRNNGTTCDSGELQRQRQRQGIDKEKGKRQRQGKKTKTSLDPQQWDSVTLWWVPGRFSCFRKFSVSWSWISRFTEKSCYWSNGTCGSVLWRARQIDGQIVPKS